MIGGMIFRGRLKNDGTAARSFIVGLTTALILTFSPGEKGQRLLVSLCAVGRRANPAASAWWFRGSRREFVGRNLFPREG